MIIHEYGETMVIITIYFLFVPDLYIYDVCMDASGQLYVVSCNHTKLVYEFQLDITPFIEAVVCRVFRDYNFTYSYYGY